MILTFFLNIFHLNINYELLTFALNLFTELKILFRIQCSEFVITQSSPALLKWHPHSHSSLLTTKPIIKAIWNYLFFLIFYLYINKLISGSSYVIGWIQGICYNQFMTIMHVVLIFKLNYFNNLLWNSCFDLCLLRPCPSANRYK